MLALLLALRLFSFEVLDNAAVVKMVSAGLGPDVILLKIERSDAQFDTTTDGLVALKSAKVPDEVIRAMLLKERRPGLSPAHIEQAHIDNCVDVKLLTNDTWQPSNVCVTSTSISVDEQTIPIADVTVQCTVKPLLGDPEWWLGDAKETLKFRGKAEDLERLARAVKHERGDIPSGGCSDREVRRHLVTRNP